MRNVRVIATTFDAGGAPKKQIVELHATAQSVVSWDLCNCVDQQCMPLRVQKVCCAYPKILDPAPHMDSHPKLKFPPRHLELNIQTKHNKYDGTFIMLRVMSLHDLVAIKCHFYCELHQHNTII